MTTNFFRKILPDICVTFSSKKGKLLFKEALEEGHMDSFFHFGAQLRTQDEPAYCGLSSLVIVLNGLSVDPGRVWKGVWRWYHESMLECCTPLEEVKSKGVSLDELTCIARCNQLIAEQVYVNDTTSIDEFRNKVKDVTKSSTTAIICSFSRQVLSQSGTGHFSPIGGYHPETDSVLMLEPARFKYPLFWIPISLLWDAMNTKDTDTGVSRGYMVLKRSNTQPTLLFRISRYFNAIHPLHADAVDFLTNAVAFLKKSCRDTNDPSTIINEVAEKLLKISAEQKANHEKGLLFHTFVKSQLQTMSPEHQKAILLLVEEIESTHLYKLLRDALVNRACCEEVLFGLNENEKVLVLGCGRPCVLCLPHYMVILLNLLAVFGPAYPQHVTNYNFTEAEYKGSYLEAVVELMEPLEIPKSNGQCSESTCCRKDENHIDNSDRGKVLLRNEIQQLRKQIVEVLNKENKEICCVSL